MAIFTRKTLVSLAWTVSILGVPAAFAGIRAGDQWQTVNPPQKAAAVEKKQTEAGVLMSEDVSEEQIKAIEQGNMKIESASLASFMSTKPMRLGGMPGGMVPDGVGQGGQKSGGIDAGSIGGMKPEAGSAAFGNPVMVATDSVMDISLSVERNQDASTPGQGGNGGDNTYSESSDSINADNGSSTSDSNQSGSFMTNSQFSMGPGAGMGSGNSMGPGAGMDSGNSMGPGAGMGSGNSMGPGAGMDSGNSMGPGAGMGSGNSMGSDGPGIRFGR